MQCDRLKSVPSVMESHRFFWNETNKRCWRFKVRTDEDAKRGKSIASIGVALPNAEQRFPKSAEFPAKAPNIICLNYFY